MLLVETATNLPASVDPGAALRFRTKAETQLAGIRSGILIFLQDERSVTELDAAVRALRDLSVTACSADLGHITQRLGECERTLTALVEGRAADKHCNARVALDLLADVEASLLSASLKDDLPFSISGFLDESFERLTQNEEETLDGSDDDSFEIDEETMEIFRSEASELLESIALNLKTLNTHPDDRDALWNIRRCAHTFKGAAGVIGLTEASELAHRVEDLLDQMAEGQHDATQSVIEVLTISTAHLNLTTLGCGTSDKSLSDIYAAFDRVIADKETRRQPSENTVSQVSVSLANDAAVAKPQPAPIVRVALDKLDELLDIVRDLANGRSPLSQHDLANELHEKLLRLRMVRFATLTTRLNRSVHVTCQEEDKKAELIIENDVCEIDTQILDSLVEPLLHLLRNAVVHGIEPAERRRLIGKPEKGQVKINVANSKNDIIITVSDDGRGISAAKLHEKALASGVLDAVSAKQSSDEETLNLIFSQGLSTADKLSLNAGRGVGMSIVKESIGSMGGSISVASEPQRGTTFTIRIPIVARPSLSVLSSNDAVHVCDRQTSNVLIIDDSSSVRQMIKRIIEDKGWKASVATDGQNAAEILSYSQDRPDVILTDLEMPHMNGYELLELLKNDSELRNIPVVMVTSKANTANRKKAFALGASDFITKPFEGKELIKIIERICRAAKTA